MKKIKLLFAAALFIHASSTFAGREILNVSTMVGDYVTSNPGFETIIAHPVDIDSNLDGTPEGFKFSLDVYKMGTNTKLFSTPEQSFVVCPNGISFSGPSTFQKRRTFAPLKKVVYVIWHDNEEKIHRIPDQHPDQLHLP